MTNLKKTLKGLVAVLMALTLSVALGVSMFASAADTVTETVVVTQVIEKGTVPKQSTYTYWLTPEDTAYPLPNELKNTTPSSEGKYKVGTITGNSTDKTALTMTFELDKTKAGTYVYYLEKTPETPSEDKFSPEKLWKFGFRIKEDEQTGKIVALAPELCVHGDSKLSDVGEDGFPTKLTLINSIKGQPTTTTTTAKQSSRSPTAPQGNSSRATTYYSARTTGTNTRARWVNTGDESNLIMWVVILAVAVIGILLMILLRKRHEDDDDESI